MLTPNSIAGSFDPITPEETASPGGQSLLDVFKSSIAPAYQQTVQSAQNQASAVVSDYEDQIKRTTGEDLFSNRFSKQDMIAELSGTQANMAPEVNQAIPQIAQKYNFDPNAFDERVEQIRAAHPNADFNVKTFNQLQQDYRGLANNQTQQSQREAAQAYGQGGIFKSIASFLGNQIGLMEDPRNILPMLVPTGEGIQLGKGALTALGSIAKTFGVGAAAMLPVEAMQEQVQKGRGEEPTNSQFFENILAGGVGNVGLSLLGKLGSAIFKHFASEKPDISGVKDAVDSIEPQGTPQEQAATRGAKANVQADLDMYKDLGIQHPDQLPEVQKNLADVMQAFDEGRPPNLNRAELQDPKNEKLGVYADQLGHSVAQLNPPDGTPPSHGVIYPSVQTSAQLEFKSSAQALGYLAHSPINPDDVTLAYDHATGKYTFLDKNISANDVAPIGNKLFDTQAEAQKFASTFGLGKDSVVNLKDGWSVLETPPDPLTRDRLVQTPFNYIKKLPDSQDLQSLPQSQPLPTTQEQVAARNSTVEAQALKTPDQMQQELDYTTNQVKIATKLNPDAVTGIQLDKDLPIADNLKGKALDGDTYQTTFKQVKSFMKEFGDCMLGGGG